MNENFRYTIRVSSFPLFIALGYDHTWFLSIFGHKEPGLGRPFDFGLVPGVKSGPGQAGPAFGSRAKRGVVFSKEVGWMAPGWRLAPGTSGTCHTSFLQKMVGQSMKHCQLILHVQMLRCWCNMPLFIKSPCDPCGQKS